MIDAVKPRLSRGLRDILPEQMLARQQIVQVIRQVYELYGFVPLETPAVEYIDVLFGTAGEETQRSVFRVANPEGENLGLRFDLTVPLARVVAQYRDLPRPFRRYQISSVWRADKPAPGRFREFTQFDIDSVGVETEVADTEIITAMCDTLSALDVGPYRVRFSSRSILNLLLIYAGISQGASKDVFRVLDKLEKLGFEKVKKELTTGYTDDSGDAISGLGLGNSQVERIKDFLEIRSENRLEVIGQLQQLFSKVTNAREEISLLARISSHLDSLGYGKDRVVLDLSVARGLDYYTGPVFEAVLLDAPQFGSIFGGGRYDDLVMRFLGEKVPATGVSIGVDRLLAAMAELRRLSMRRSTAKVFVAVLDDKLIEDYLTLTYELRRAGIPTEMYLGNEKSVGKQIKYANTTGVPIVALYGQDEKAHGVINLKNMAQGRELASKVSGREEWRKKRPGQQEVSRKGAVNEIRKLLTEIEGIKL